MPELNPALRKYYLLRGALLNYERLPWELETEQSARLHEAVMKELSLTERVMKSGGGTHLCPEAAVVDAFDDFLEQLSRIGTAGEILDRSGLNPDSLHEAIAIEAGVAQVLETIMAAVAPSEEELKTLYERHRDRFVVPEKREAFHLLITINGDYSENSREQARARMGQIETQLAGQGADFGELARRHSECPTAVEAGRIGLVPRGHLYPVLDERLFTMNEGETSNVLESPLGFHLLRCGAIEPARQLHCEEVKAQLAEHIGEKQRRRRLQEWLDGK